MPGGRTVDGLYDQAISFDEDHHHGKYDTLITRRDQYIPDDYVAQLKRDKINSDHNRFGEFTRIATIPVVFVEKWKREGFDLYNATAKEIVAKLHADGLDAFATGASV